LLLNVTIERSLGPVQVVISPEKTTGDLIKAALEIYAREKRRPLLPETDPHRFELHYSQFSLEGKFSLVLLCSLETTLFNGAQFWMLNGLKGHVPSKVTDVWTEGPN